MLAPVPKPRLAARSQRSKTSSLNGRSRFQRARTSSRSPTYALLSSSTIDLAVIGLRRGGTSDLDRPDRVAALLDVKMADLEALFRAPRPDLLLGVAVRVARVVPVEVHVLVLLELEGVVPEELGHVPVDQPLDVVAPLRDAEQLDVGRDHDLCL